MTIHASFDPATGVLTETGDNLGNTITTSRDAAGQIFVNGDGGAVPIDGGQPTFTNTTEIVVSGGNRDDTISLDESNGLLPPAQLFGGSGNDVLTGGSGADQLFGGAGNDTVVGGKGNDTAFLGAGNDTFIWNPGEGSDVVEGQAGFDTLLFKNADTASSVENVSILADGSRAKLIREFNNGTVTMGLNGVERIQLDALGGVDNITVNDLTGTDVKQVAIDLAGSAGGGDGQIDTINIIATNPDAITVANEHGVITVSGSGLASDVTISNFEATDVLQINGVTVAAVNSNNAGGTSTASDGSHAAGVALLGQHMASSFVTAGDGQGGTPIADPSSSQQPLLTQPHA